MNQIISIPPKFSYEVLPFLNYYTILIKPFRKVRIILNTSMLLTNLNTTTKSNEENQKIHNDVHGSLYNQAISTCKLERLFY